MSSAGLIIRIAILLVSLFGLLIGYYWVHKPADLGVFIRLGGILADALTVFVIFLAAGGLGRLGQHALRLDAEDRLSRPEALALMTGLGLGGLSIAALILGLVGPFTTQALAGLVVIALIISLRQLPAVVRLWRAVAASALRPDTRWAKFCAVVIGLVLLGSLLTAFAPPLTWDALTYHLVGIDRYFADGAIRAHGDNFYLGFPENVEMLFALAQAPLRRETTAALLHFGVGVLGLLATAGLARRWLSRDAGWTAALLLMGAYNFAALFGWAYVDLGAFLYGALAIVCALTWRERHCTGWLIAFGAVVGLSAGVKYTAGAVALSAALLVAWSAPRRMVFNVGIVALAALLVFLPWAIKGMALYGNPIYPLAFNGLEWDGGRAALFSFNERSLIRDGQAWQLALLPVAATIFGRDLTDGYGFTAGAFLLTAWLALPIVFFALDDRAKAFSRAIVVWLIPLIGVWTALSAYSVVGQQTRLMVVALPGFALASAAAFHGLSRFPRKPVDIGFIIRAAFIVTLMLHLIDITTSVARSRVVGHLTGVVSREDYFYAQTGAYYGAMQALETLPAGSQVRLMWEPRGYYCPANVSCIGDMLFDHWSRPIAAGQSEDETFAAFRAAGDDYWLLFHSGYETYLGVSQRRAIDEVFAAALEQAMVPVWTDGLRYTLYTWPD